MTLHQTYKNACLKPHKLHWMQFKLVLEGYLVWKLLFHVSGDLFDETKFVISFDFDFSGPIHRIFFLSLDATW